jgi:hypothetical protein
VPFTHFIRWAKGQIQDLSKSSKHGHNWGAVARVRDGQEEHLSLRRYHVDVFIENGVARTAVDQTYFNHLSDQTEGTFFFHWRPMHR